MIRDATAPASSPPPSSRSPSSVDPYIALHAGLVQVHHALIGSLHMVASAAPDAAISQALATGQFMLGHHAMESTVVFPALRRHGALRSTDVAFLDACDRQHEDVHALCDRLLATAGAPHPELDAIRTIARELRTSFTAHIIEEEAGLMPERLRTMITVAGLDELGGELAAFQRRHR